MCAAVVDPLIKGDAGGAGDFMLPGDFGSKAGETGGVIATFAGADAAASVPIVSSKAGLEFARFVSVLCVTVVSSLSMDARLPLREVDIKNRWFAETCGGCMAQKLLDEFRAVLAAPAPAVGRKDYQPIVSKLLAHLDENLSYASLQKFNLVAGPSCLCAVQLE